MIKVFAFDFDGVLVNSALDWRALCFEAWKRMGNNTKNISRKQATKMRTQIRDAKESYGLFYLLDKKLPINRESILEIARKENKKSNQFYGLFYKIRYEWQQKNTEKYLGLYKPYTFAIEAFKELQKQAKVYVISNKDKKTIALLLIP